MTVRQLYLILFIFLFCSCSEKQSAVDKDEVEEIEIVNLVFDATVGHDTIWTKHLKVPIPFPLPPGQLSSQDRIEHENYLKEIDSIKARLDTALLYVFLNDSLVKFPERRNITTMLKVENYKANFPDIDNAFRPLVLTLTDSTQSRKLEINSVKTKFNYKLDYTSNKEKYASDIVTIGRVTISRVVFNQERSMACVYSEIVCGGECGGGSIIFLKKVTGQWKIVGQRELWVS